MSTYFKNLSDADEESIVEIIESTISLLDDVHCYDSDEFKELKAVRDALKYNADLNDAIEMYKNGE